MENGQIYAQMLKVRYLQLQRALFRGDVPAIIPCPRKMRGTGWNLQNELKFHFDRLVYAEIADVLQCSYLNRCEFTIFDYWLWKKWIFLPCTRVHAIFLMITSGIGRPAFTKTISEAISMKYFLHILIADTPIIVQYRAAIESYRLLAKKKRNFAGTGCALVED